MKKGQAAISVILFVVLGMFLFYLLWVNPSERMSLLGFDEEEAEENETTTPEWSNVMFEKEIGYIGKKTGALIKEHELEDVKLEYPPVEDVVWEKGTAVLTANVLFKGEMKTTIPGDYAFVEVTSKVGEVIGTPRLEITSNDVVLFRGEILRNQDISLVVDSAKIIGDSLEISCQWHGLTFWKQQKCELLDLEIKKVSYKEINPRETRQVTLSKKQSEGGSYKLYFDVDESVNTNNFNMLINGVEVYNEAPKNRSESYFIKGSISSVDFAEGENLIDFVALPGSSYYLSGVKLNIFEKVSEESNMTFYFNISSKIYNGAKNFTVLFKIEDIIESGGLDIIFGNKEYWFAPSQLVVGDNWLNVKKSDIGAGANKLRISSGTGRFKIGTMSMMWE